MAKLKRLFGFGAIATVALAAHWTIATPPAQANCSDWVGRVEYWQSPMQQHWQQLQQQIHYPWGQARPYGQFLRDRITLTADFDRLTGTQKQQVLTLLLNPDWQQIITPQEQQAGLEQGTIGAIPYPIYASDGRLISGVYDGCTRMTLLTERSRYSWYYNSIGRTLPNNLNREALRNVGTPAWRIVQVPISAAAERRVRAQFWNAIGYRQADQGYWIAWVPEGGYFEINVPSGDDAEQLSFWRIAPREYRYRVVGSDGTLIREVNFNRQGN
ncbi:phosphoribosylaminoimidazolesuccinocarboxamide synthase [Leptolyngbya ohadii]|uniref:phosphoribosylaminoimidazolesuccinocarboxamide synthase n=1 Tax=Leptolyngbya ohadii TaxID=1962290 RepID=UPI000B59DCE5|nr:phosphoribosylaminoimidazolesuccinocarboxamide synthase [Leptolyngbya ohadii]